MKSSLPSIRFLAAPAAPAMALMEALVAGAILASALVCFLNVLRDARLDVQRARETAIAIAMAETSLEQAEIHWPNIERARTEAGFASTLVCAPSSQILSPRLVLVRCSAVLVSPSGARIRLSTGWAARRVTFPP